jgi:xanthine dehydrogenase accessory factor
VDERVFAQLEHRLAEGGAVVLASVTGTRGAVPRRRGSRMLVTRGDTAFSIGGGEAEARVVEAARRLLRASDPVARIDIDLGGGADAAGVCGGGMRIALRRWQGEADLARARELAAALRAGRTVALSASEAGSEGADELLRPNERLLIVGGGHCGLALCELARPLDFELWVYDARPECFASDRFAGARTLSGPPSELGLALETARPVYAVLLNRDFHADVSALRELCAGPPAFWTMMGSRRRIAEVRAALPQFQAQLETLVAPAGLELDAETPHEIAVSILAQLVQARRRLRVL